MDVIRIENELKKRVSLPYKWGRKQNNDWDKKTSFIYTTFSFSTLLKNNEPLNQLLQEYALNRWYNFWSAMAVEFLFASHLKVKPNKNAFDKLVDFQIDAIYFDHKTTVFPVGFNQSFQYAKNNKKELIEWLYNNQSQEGRKHFKNRLFIVLFDKSNNEHWKMKAEIQLLKQEIDNYVKHFSIHNLTKLNYDNQAILSDIIWVEKE